LYRLDRFVDYGVFTPLLTKTADLTIVEEQWEEMLRVALSLKQRTAPAHVIVQRLTNSFPADRLAKAFTNLGRIIKTQYILRYLTDRDLRQTVQLQLNKGEYGLRQRFVHYSHTAHPTAIMGTGVFTKPLAPFLV
jgi:TnpA family transposase